MFYQKGEGLSSMKKLDIVKKDVDNKIV